MTTGATGQLGLALPVQGELSGTWGDTVNNGITQYTNIAIAGTLTLTGDGAVTLANTTGDASASNITSTLAGAGTVTAQFAVVRVSGTTTTKVVTGPSYSKTYLVDNASSFAVTFKASGQTGVSVAAAEKVSVYFNGTDYVKIAGTIANAAGSNTQIQFNNGGLFGASSSLTWDGTTLSTTQVNITGQGTLRLQDTTGGEYVGLRSPSALGASYTLTFPADDGTSGQALITDGSGGLSWSTAASGDVYGPASSTDNAVARFDSTTGKLLQNSVVLIGDTGDVTGVGTLSAATLTLTNALGTAYGGTGLTSFTSGGVVYASSTSALATGSALTFNGADLTVANGDLTIGTNGKKLYVNYIANNSGADLNTNGLTNQIFSIGGSEAMRLTSSSLYTASGINVGFGTSSPTQTAANRTVLSVNGTTTALINLNIGNTPKSYWYYDGTDTKFVGASGKVILSTSGTDSVILDTAGNLGIGQTPPTGSSGYNGINVGTAMLIGAPNAGLNQLTSNADISDKYIVNGYASKYQQYNSIHSWFTAASGTAGNAISFTQAMTLDASGRLGIGTTSPADSLHVNSASGSTYIRVTNATGDRTYIGAEGGLSVIYAQTSAGANAPLAFLTGSTERARITSSGDVQISTSKNDDTTLYVQNGNAGTASTARFDLRDSSSHYLTLRTYGQNATGTTLGVSNAKLSAIFDNSVAAESSGLVIGTSPATPLMFSTNGTERVRIDASGNVGIGTSSPSYPLHVNATGNGTKARFTNGTTTLDLYCGGTEVYTGTAGATTSWAYANANTYIAGYVNGSEQMRLTSTGLGIGTSSPSAKLDVTGDISIANSANAATANFFNTNASLTAQVIQSIAVKAAGTDFTLFRGTSNSSVHVFNVFGNGNVTNTNNSYAGISDVKLKENIVDATPKLANLMQIKVRNYNLKSDPSFKQIGVIAQELETIFPALVEETKDSDVNGNDLGTTTKSVKYSVFVPMLIKAMQEQQAIIESLKARLDAANL